MNRTELNANLATAKHTPTGPSLHLKMSQVEREKWRLANWGVFAKLGRIHNVTGNYVRDIFKGRKPIRSSKAKAISKSLDREIERTRRAEAR